MCAGQNIARYRQFLQDEEIFDMACEAEGFGPGT